MPKKSPNELKTELEDAYQKLGEKFPHSNTAIHEKSRGRYTINSVVFEEATMTVVVVYSMFDHRVGFTRPLESFLEKFRPPSDLESLEATRLSRRPL